MPDPPIETLTADVQWIGTKARRSMVINVAKRFLQYSEGATDFNALERYRRHLDDEGYTSSTISEHFHALRRLYSANSFPWPYGGRGKSGPRPPGRKRSDIQRPALHPDFVRDMIHAAQDGVLLPEQSAYLALASIYAFRRRELAAITMDAFDLEQKIIRVTTAKTGVIRTHLIPPGILPYITNGSLSAVSPTTMTLLYQDMECRVSGQEQKLAGTGWHSFRRTLRSELDVVPADRVKLFFGWQGEGEDSTESIYLVQEYVRPGAPATVQVSDRLRAIDEEIFRHHPFVRDWLQEDANGTD